MNAIGTQVRLFESLSPQHFSFYCSLMFGSAELDCQSAKNDVRVVKKLATLKTDDSGGGRLQTLLHACPRHEAILFHEVDLSRYDLDRSLYQLTPVVLFRLDCTFERNSVGTSRELNNIHICCSLVCL